jgi:hypothetical protein
MENCPFQEGDQVKILSQSFAWGNLKPGDTAKIRYVVSEDGRQVIYVDALNQSMWKGLPKDFQLLNLSNKESLHLLKK